MKELKVLSRKAARNESFRLIERTGIISITDFGSEINRFARSDKIIGICRAAFDDTLSGKSSISKTDAFRIASFIKMLPEDADLIIHCEAGISRSAGVAAAICFVKNIDDSWLWDAKGRFAPNVTVAEMITKEFGIDPGLTFQQKWIKLIEETRKEFDNEKI